MADRKFHLAQANIANMRAPLEDPVMAEFAAQLAPINALADRSAGFVWRFQSEEGDATAIRVFENELILFNMSVWESLRALFQYVYKSDHIGPLSNRRQWFHKMEGPTSVLWWIPTGILPTVEEAKSRLESLRANGATPEAFTFTENFAPPGGDDFALPTGDNFAPSGDGP